MFYDGVYTNIYMTQYALYPVIYIKTLSLSLIKLNEKKGLLGLFKLVINYCLSKYHSLYTVNSQIIATFFKCKLWDWVSITIVRTCILISNQYTHLVICVQITWDHSNYSYIYINSSRIAIKKNPIISEFTVHKFYL